MDDSDWRPPTEAEMKVIEEKRARSNKVSALMGQYLLKRYKMLAETCDVCQTILLQEPSGSKYCVACSELDCEGDKDNPAVCEAAAQSVIQEGRVKEELVEFPPMDWVSQPQKKRIVAPVASSNPTKATLAAPLTAGDAPVDCSYNEVASVLNHKMKWATSRLQQADTPEKVKLYSEVIASITHALHGVHKLQSA